MNIEPKTYIIHGKILVLRSAMIEDAALLLPYLKRVCGETRFLLKEADECEDLSLEEEEIFIKSHTEKERACLILAFLDGEYIGNASFEPAGVSRRTAHRAELGIALYLAYTGMGIGTKLFETLMETVKKCGYESAELTVVAGNDRAKHLYETFGFQECGRVPNANKYDDGTYADDIKMFKKL